MANLNWEYPGGINPPSDVPEDTGFNVVSEDYIEEEYEEGGDEAINLADVLSARDDALSEDELWALCRECCLVLEVVNNSPESFDTLCITPDTVAFDNAGNVCFLDLGSDPEALYLPPEYSPNGNSYKSHLYSLGMTLLFAAEYNKSDQSGASSELRELFGCMTSEDIKQRPELEHIITECEEQLVGKSSQEVCATIIQFTSLTENTGIDSTEYADVTSGVYDYLPTKKSPSELNITRDPLLQEDNTVISAYQQQQHKELQQQKSNSQSHVQSSPLENHLLSNSEAEDKPNDLEMPVRDHFLGPMPTGNRPESSSRKTPQVPPRSSLDKNKKSKPREKPALPSKPDSLRRKSFPAEDPKDSSISESVTESVLERSADKSKKCEETAVDRIKEEENTSNERHSSGASDVGNQTSRPRRKALTVSDTLHLINRYLTEDELCGVGRECIIALRRKRKHLPTIISPDTLLLKETGNLSFKTVTTDKPPEVMFTAPELLVTGSVTEQTCVFGLGVTLRCLAGDRKVSVKSLGLSDTFQNVLGKMVSADPIERPDFDEVSEVCGDLEREAGVPSSLICQSVYQEANTRLQSLQSVTNENSQGVKTPIKNNTPGATTSVSSALSSNVSSVIHTSSTSGFKPVPGPLKSSPQNDNSVGFRPVQAPSEKKVESSVPAAYRSAATHFKPIVLQHRITPLITDKKSEIKTSSDSQHNSDESDNNKDKEVVRKLKELKQNLMKHKTREVELTEKESGKQNKVNQRVSTPVKVTDSVDKMKISTASRHSSDASEKEQKVSSSNSSKRNSGVLESLLSQLQLQGNMPDTEALASAIASHLHVHLTQNKAKSPQNQSASDISPSAVSQNSSSKSIPNQSANSSQGNTPQGNTFPQAYPYFPTPSSNLQNLPNLNIPASQHPQLLGQTMVLPQPAIGLGMNPTLQVQLVQDPKTGFLQLVPVNIVATPVSHAMSDDMNSEGVNRSGTPGETGSAIMNSSFNSNKSRGRTAKDLVAKTANKRNKNYANSVHSETPPSHFPQDGDNSLWRSKSAHAIHQLDSHGAMVYPSQTLPHQQGQVKGDTGVAGAQPFSNHGGMYSPSSRIANQNTPARPRSSYQLQTNSQYFVQPQRTRSQSSSPSPSKDSGVSGMNGGYKPPAPGSLMERLLSNVNVKQQPMLGNVVHLLREEFAFDGYMENGVEDLAMAEYVVSLANLKWETFASAISEKYSDLYWSVELLISLYEAVNGCKPEIYEQLMKKNVKDIYMSKGNESPVKLPGLDDPSHSTSRSSSSGSSSYPASKCRDYIPTNTVRPPSLEPLSLPGSSDSSDSEVTERRHRYRRRQHADKIKIKSAYNEPPFADVFRDADSKVRLKSHATTEDLTRIKEEYTTKYPEIGHQKASTEEEGVKDPFSVDQDVPPPSLRQTAWTASSEELAPAKSNQSNHSPSQMNANESGKNRLIPEKPPRNALGNSVCAPAPKSDSSPGSKVKNVVRHESSSSAGSTNKIEGIPHQMLVGERSENHSLSQKRRCHVIFHSAMAELSKSLELQEFAANINEDNAETLGNHLASLQQQLQMEKKQRRKSQLFYTKLTTDANTKNAKNEQKSQLAQVAKDVVEMNEKIRSLELCCSHIEMLQAELNGIHSSYLLSIATCEPGHPLHLTPCPVNSDNSVLQFQVIRDQQTQADIQSLQAGRPEGLMAFLFASGSLREGFIHQFLYCFRYFTTPGELLSFLAEKHKSASFRSNNKETKLVKIQHRVLDVLYFWLEGFYSIDFEGNVEIMEQLRAFVHLNEISSEPQGQDLQELLATCEGGCHSDITPGKDENEPDVFRNNIPKKEYLHEEWGSLKNILKAKSSTPGLSVFAEKRTPVKAIHDDTYFSKPSRRTDTFTLADYSYHSLAEQLTLIAQSLFQLTHPVHYLNSKAQGVSVALTMSNNRASSNTRLNSYEDQNLFVTDFVMETSIQQFLDFQQELSHWVAAEIVSCSNQKSQISVLTKFIQTAQLCKDIRNFSSCIAILDGLEFLVVKQLPAWKHLSTKYLNIIEEMKTLKMSLKSDSLATLKNKNDFLKPTIPCVLLYLLHVQQLEIGNFRLANGMYKWSKMRTICKLIDQIRIFKDHIYGFDGDEDMQDSLVHRIREFSGQDIQFLASQNDTNFTKVSSGGISATFRKMKGKFSTK